MANLDMESCEWLIEHRNDPWVKNHRAERLKKCLDQQEKRSRRKTNVLLSGLDVA